MTLSPATQAVKDAAIDAQAGHEYCQYRQIAAAALRAAVEQVLPDQGELPPARDSATGHYCHGWRDSQQAARRDLLAIATELETHQ